MKLSFNPFFIIIIGLMVLISKPGSLYAQIAASLQEQQIDSLLTRYHDLNRLNGVVLVAKNGEKILSKGYGSASLEWNIPNSPETRYMLASVSETFTATLIMRLIDQGKLTLETKLSQALPWYRKDVGDKVTIYELLNHTSGIPNYMNMKVHSIALVSGYKSNNVSCLEVSD